MLMSVLKINSPETCTPNLQCVTSVRHQCKKHFHYKKQSHSRQMQGSAPHCGACVLVSNFFQSHR